MEANYLTLRGHIFFAEKLEKYIAPDKALFQKKKQKKKHTHTKKKKKKKTLTVRYFFIKNMFCTTVITLSTGINRLLQTVYTKIAERGDWSGYSVLVIHHTIQTRQYDQEVVAWTMDYFKF